MKILIMLLLLMSFVCFAGGEEGTGIPGDDGNLVIQCFETKTETICEVVTMPDDRLDRLIDDGPSNSH